MDQIRTSWAPGDYRCCRMPDDDTKTLNKIEIMSTLAPNQIFTTILTDAASSLIAWSSVEGVLVCA